MPGAGPTRLSELKCKRARGGEALRRTLSRRPRGRPVPCAALSRAETALAFLPLFARMSTYSPRPLAYMTQELGSQHWIPRLCTQGTHPEVD